jgi:glutaredoxin
MKQQCHISTIYFSWIVYAGGLIYAAWRSSWLLALGWVIAAPVCQWLYIRYFPKFSKAMGYGPIVDAPAGKVEAAPVTVTLYTALGCPFCPLIEQRLEELQARLGFSLDKTDVTLRPDLLASKGIRSVPAVEIGDQFFTGLVTSRELAEAIARPQTAAKITG